MVGEMLVSKSTAVKGKNGDALSGFGTGLNGKKESACAIEKSLKPDGKKLLSESIMLGAQPLPKKRNGVKHRLHALCQTMAVLGGNGAPREFVRSQLEQGASAPLSSADALDVVNYHYWKWLSKQHQDDEAVQLKFLSCQKIYYHLRSMAKKWERREAAHQFVFGIVERIGPDYAYQMINAKKRLDAALERNEDLRAIGVSMLEKRKEEQVSSVEDRFARRDADLSAWIKRVGGVEIGSIKKSISGALKETKFGPVVELVKKFKIPGIGALLAGASSVFPALPMEYVGLGLIGAWVGLMVHLNVMKRNNPTKKQRAREKIEDRIKAEIKKAEREFSDKASRLVEHYSIELAQIKAQLEEAYGELAARFGYLSAASG